jgi:hypothetical protein
VATKLTTLLGRGPLGLTALGLLSTSIASATNGNYDNIIRQFFTFCHEENSLPMHAAPPTVVRCTAWLGLKGTVAARSM